MRREQGFTLIEVMVTAAIAVPSYSEYVRRARITEAISRLADMHIKMERYFQDNRSYAPPAPAIQPCQPLTVAPLPAPTTNFTFACGGLSATTYVVTATGIPGGPMAQFVYTLDQNNNRATTGVPAGWALNPLCWVLKRDGSC